MDVRAYTKDEFHTAIIEGEKTVSKLPEINASLFLDGITHYKKLQLPSALIFLWSTIEFIIYKIWDDTIVPTGKGIEKRKDFVKSGAWTAAHKIEVLFQAGIISGALYRKLNTARVARNNLAHKGTAPDLQACDSALDAVFSLISLRITNLKQENDFLSLAKKIKKTHKPITKPLQPQYWRHVLHVPGSKEWGDAAYPKHTEIELLPLEKIKKR